MPFRAIIRGLAHEPVRVAFSVLAVAAGVCLILVFEGFKVGLYRQAYAFAAGLPADLIAMQPGVSNILGARSVLPQKARAEVERVLGVAAAHPLAGVPVIYSRGDNVTPVYVIAYDTAGGPARLMAGHPIAAAREIVVDAALAARYRFHPGDDVEFLGQHFTIAGLSGDTANPLNPYVFVRLEDLIDMYINGDLTAELADSALSFLLIDVLPGYDVRSVRAALSGEVADVAVFTPDEVGSNDVRRTNGFLGPALSVLVGTAHIVAVLVVGLTIYLAILGRSHELAVMKALGAGTRFLVGLIMVETSILCGLAFIIAVPAAVGLGSLVAWAAPQYAVDALAPAAIRNAALALLVATTCAGVIPLWKVSRVDPARAFGAPS